MQIKSIGLVYTGICFGNIPGTCLILNYSEQLVPTCSNLFHHWICAGHLP